MDVGAIQTTSGFICGAIVGCGGMWMVMRLKLDAVRSTAILFSDWWMSAEDRLEEAHEKHVRAGRTAHERQREQVKDVAVMLAISAPSPLKDRAEIEIEARRALAERRNRISKVAA